MTGMSEEQKLTPQRSLDLLESCIEGLQIAIDMVSQAAAVNKTYTYLEAEKGFDYKVHEESFRCVKYIMDEFHKFIDELPDGEESKKERENNKGDRSLPDFVRSELKKSLGGMIESRNKLEASLSMYDALSQLNLDEEGFRYKFTIENHIVNLITINDAITEFLKPLIIRAFGIRKSRIGTLREVEQDRCN